LLFLILLLSTLFPFLEKTTVTFNPNIPISLSYSISGISIYSSIPKEKWLSSICFSFNWFEIASNNLFNKGLIFSLIVTLLPISSPGLTSKEGILFLDFVFTGVFPVIILNMDQTHRAKTLNCYQEVSSRNAPVLIITNDISISSEVSCDIIYVPENKSYASLLGIIPIQLLAYHLSINKGINPDKPKNLAKVVTVE